MTALQLVRVTWQTLLKPKESVQFRRWFFRKFSGGHAPRVPYCGGATAPLRRP